VNAIVFSQTGGPEVLRLSEVPKPEVRPGMVLIRVHAIGVNFADTRFMRPTVTRNFPDKTRESAERCFALMRDGRLKLHIGKTFALADAAAAHRHLESRQSTGKLVLIP